VKHSDLMAFSELGEFPSFRVTKHTDGEWRVHIAQPHETVRATSVISLEKAVDKALDLIRFPHAPRRRIDVDGRDVTDEAGLWCETDHFIAADAAIRKDDINLSNCQKCGEFMGHGHVCPTPTKARTA
jgi:hypothetical protein